MSGKNPRQIAARILSQRLTNGEFTENLLETALAATRLSPADRGLCHELVCGVVRWQATLDCLIDRKTDPARQQRPALKNLLRLGLYQLFWLDRVPPHAAVHETVELAKQSGYGAQAGFINAVLRQYVRESDGIKKILADMKISQPALGWSHPDWLVEKWQRQYGDDNTRKLLEWNNIPPTTYARVNALKFSGSRPEEAQDSALSTPRSALNLPAAAGGMKDAGDLVARWREENVDYDFFTRDWTGENLVFALKSHPSLARLGSFLDGWFYVQDPSTLLAPVVLDPQPGESVLDLCAAPGGKTTFMAQLMQNRGRIVASDLDPNRLKRVKENCARLGVTCAEIRGRRGDEDQSSTPPPALSTPPSSEFDRILVDAPCSNTGVLRRRVDLRWRLQAADIERLRATQLGLLNQAAAMLKPGGVLVYSTCSLEPEENAGVVDEFLSGHSGFQLETTRQLLPFADGVDGAYVARLKRT
ncbi:MAG: 16S rRNA (cytosine(967)-C(5))-methyltransferase RsmB [Verrucomicrobiota bacterium]